VRPPKTARPAIGDGPPLKSDERPGSLDQTNIPDTANSQAPLLADTAGENDWEYFGRRPAAAVRTRFPLEGEFPDDFLEHGGAVPFVRVAVVRDDNGLPVWAARSVQFCSGGSA
jgi:hypothetical protein